MGLLKYESKVEELICITFSDLSLFQGMTLHFHQYSFPWFQSCFNTSDPDKIFGTKVWSETFCILKKPSLLANFFLDMSASTASFIFFTLHSFLLLDHLPALHLSNIFSSLLLGYVISVGKSIVQSCWVWLESPTSWACPAAFCHHLPRRCA